MTDIEDEVSSQVAQDVRELHDCPEDPRVSPVVLGGRALEEVCPTPHPQNSRAKSYSRNRMSCLAKKKAANCEIQTNDNRSCDHHVLHDVDDRPHVHHIARCTPEHGPDFADARNDPRRRKDKRRHGNVQNGERNIAQISWSRNEHA